MYIDGALDATLEIGPVVAYTGPAPLMIGSAMNTDHGDKGVFYGDIHEVRIYSRALSASEIGELHIDPLAGAALLRRAIEIVRGLDPASLRNPNAGNTLGNKMEAVISLIEAERYQDALSKLQKDVLPKIDGCALRGEPDKDDWIVTCEAQQGVYPVVLQAAELLEELM